MTKRSQASKMPVVAEDATIDAEQNNLINLEEGSSKRSLPNELNQKINKIDADLNDLRSELSATNKGVKNSLSHLADTDKDLTSRVSETYRQLGELDTSYKSLSDKSSKISKEIKGISKNIVQITEQSEADIGTLTEGYGTLITRTDELAKKSKLATQNLNKSIKQNAKAMGELEQQLMAEIDTLAKTTQERDDALTDTTEALNSNLTKAEEEIKSSQARLLKLQAVDQALEKRSEALESTSDELSKKSRELSRSTTTLNQRTSQLSAAIEALQAKTEEHSGLIANLQDRTEQTAKVLFALIMREKRHFWTLGAVIALVILALGGFFVYENANWQTEAQTNASLQTGLNNVNSELSATDNQLANLGNRVAEQNGAVQDKLSAIDSKLVTIGDQVDSLDGRLSNLRPHREFGNGNVIHGPQWLAQQPANLYVIHLATVSDKQDLYKLAERYSRYLQADLAYLPVQHKQSQRFALVYGKFATEAEANSILARLPRYIERQHPEVQSMDKLQRYMTN